MKMKTKLFGLLALLLMLCTVAMSAKKVHTLGDSTMAPYDESATVTRGWGMYFGNSLCEGDNPRLRRYREGRTLHYTVLHDTPTV